MSVELLGHMAIICLILFSKIAVPSISLVVTLVTLKSKLLDLFFKNSIVHQHRDCLYNVISSISKAIGCVPHDRIHASLSMRLAF